MTRFISYTSRKIISRINGFTYAQTDYDYYTGELKEVSRTAYSDGLRSKVNCYGANDVREGVAIMWKEGVDAVSYTHLLWQIFFFLKMIKF